RHGRQGSVYPVAPLLGPGRGAGDWPTEVRGQRPAPCSGPAAPTLHPWVCAWACSRARVLPPWPWAWPAGPRVRGCGSSMARLAGEV
ncbi:MAG: hypothetical protein KKD99_07580, partial [Proteobacteria bacterium]|nr:hypothetical protein [Pseudomonadota bacterium]